MVEKEGLAVVVLLKHFEVFEVSNKPVVVYLWWYIYHHGPVSLSSEVQALTLKSNTMQGKTRLLLSTLLRD